MLFGNEQTDATSFGDRDTCSDVLLEKTLLEGEEEEMEEDIYCLIGFQVKDRVSSAEGEVTDVADYSGNIVLTLAISGKEVLLPFSGHYITDVDMKHHRLEVQIPPELTELN